MDGVLCDFEGAVNAHPNRDKYKNKIDCIPGIFKDLEPLPGAIEAFEYLWDVFDVYILSTPPWNNPDGWIHKREWVEKYIPKAKKRLILSHHKNLNRGDYLIDDSHYRGQADFGGEWIHFGTPDYPNWESVLLYFNNMNNDDDLTTLSQSNEDLIKRHNTKLSSERMKDTNGIPYTGESPSDSFDENLTDIVTNINKLSSATNEADAEKALSEINNEEMQMYDREVSRMNEMMSQLDSELKGLQKISTNLNKKK
jgi:5'-nucleotidase